MEQLRGLPESYLVNGETVVLPPLPGSPVSRDDPEREHKRREFEVWRNAIRQLRVHAHDFCANDPEEQKREIDRCKRAGAPYFLAMWGWMDDPRISPITERPIGSTPFIPYPFQIDMLDWFEQRLTKRGMKADGLISKSRDMGATWCACGWSLYGWLFKPSWQVRLISRKEDLVDKKNDMDSMFARIDFMMNRLPEWMLPPGFQIETHRTRLHLKNPKTLNVISGESTTSKTLRGGRTTVAIYDEAAFIPDFKGVWGTGTNAASVRIAISSESMEEGDDFVNLRTGKGGLQKPEILELDWWRHTEHDERWYREMKERFGADEEGFAREVERNPHAGFGTFIYKEAQHIEVGQFPYEFGMPVYIGIDPGLQDLCALVALAKDPLTGRFRAFEAYAARGMPPEYYASLLLGIPSGEFNYQSTRVYNPHDFMAAMRGIDSFTIFGDPAGHNKTGVAGTKDSWYTKMEEYYAAHHPFQRGLPLVVNWSMDARKFQGRRSALMNLIPLIDFHDTPGVRGLLESLKENRFENASKGRLTESAKPTHNDDSHIVAALEYVAVNIEAMRDASIPTQGVLDAA